MWPRVRGLQVGIFFMPCGEFLWVVASATTSTPWNQCGFSRWSTVLQVWHRLFSRAVKAWQHSGFSRW